MTDEVRQEDREAADDVFDALSERYGVPAVYRTALANDFAAHASPLRTRIAELETWVEQMTRCGFPAIEKTARATLNGEKKHG